MASSITSGRRVIILETDEYAALRSLLYSLEGSDLAELRTRMGAVADSLGDNELRIIGRLNDDLGYNQVG